MPISRTSRQRGFSMIELLIVIAIIGIIAAVAVPNLLQNRIRANESATVASLLAYVTAQDAYSKGNFAVVAGNPEVLDDEGDPVPRSYCPNYRFLYYGHPNDGTGNPAPGQLALISQPLADACGVENEDFDSGPDYTPVVLNGYFFREPKDFGSDRWQYEYALLAFPANSGNTGSKAMWIGRTRTVYSQTLTTMGKKGDDDSDSGIATPSGGGSGWAPQQ